MPNTLILVAGPSGAGKDSIINACRPLLASDARIYFARRVVTRDAQSPGELLVSVPAFEKLKAEGGLAFDWAAHGLMYGLPREELLPDGMVQVIIASVSRIVIPAISAQYPSHVVFINASDSHIRERLHLRDREMSNDIEERLSRKVLLPEDVPMTTIQNDGTLAEAATQFRTTIFRFTTEV
ncbi:PhnN protein [Acidithiobacillus ferrianus]|uniref:PhnN protein n=1 Tax=Acidithiobacillus ferrianus TaxID=2678518 RepID=UPI0034E4E28E